MGLKGLPTFIREYCLKLATQTIKDREKTGQIRKDIMQYLIQLRNNSTNVENDEWKINASGIYSC